MNRPESREWNEQSRRWALAAGIGARLADDTDLAEAFERTPGKVLRDLGVRENDVVEVLAIVQRARDLAIADLDGDG